MSESLFAEFELRRIGEPLFEVAGHSISFTSAALFMFISVFCAFFFYMFAIRHRAVVPGRLQMFAEVLYDLVGSVLEGGAGHRSRPFFPFMLSIFSFIFFCNLTGLLPHSVSVTSHVVANFSVAMILFLVIIVTGFVKHGLHFVTVFLPPGTPKFAAPVMFAIEMFSFSVRPFSLSLRLFGNMLAGHLLLHVFAGLAAGLLAAGWYAGLSIFPLLADITIIAFEFFVAFLQAYIYSILSSVYLHDALEMH